MAVLFLDPGTSMGWALRGKSFTASGVWNLKPSRFEGGGMRFMRLRGFIAELHATAEIRAVYFEEVRAHKGVDAAHIYGGCLATVSSWCEENMIPYQGVPVQHIKKFVTGKGNADKKAVIAAVKTFGFTPQDDNEADALALMLLKLEDKTVQEML